jgi:SAM-dependent methyltransferase
VTEAPGFYERPGLNTETYDARVAVEATDEKLAGDVAFYVDLATKSPGPVLELGCGTGRVALALADAGHDVVGLDLSQAMLAVARSKLALLPEDVRMRVRFVEADMSDFEVGGSFALAIAPFRAFQALLEPASQRACLLAVARHLRPGGLLALQLFDPRLDLCAPGAEDRLTGERPGVEHPQTGRRVRITIVSRRNDPMLQRFEELWRFEELGEDGDALRSEEERLRLRWSYRWEMRHLFELCGYEIEAEYSDFAGSPPAYGAEQIWLARRPG